MKSNSIEQNLKNYAHYFHCSNSVIYTSFLQAYECVLFPT